MATAYWINDFVIGGKAVTDGFYLLEGTEYAPALSPRRAVIEAPNTHYAIPQWDDPMSQITVSLKIRIASTSPENLTAKWNTLMGLLGMGSNQPVQLTRVRGTIKEYADAQLVSMNSPDFSCPRSRVDATIIFQIPGGAWRGPQTDVTFTKGTSLVLPNARLSTLPIADALILAAGPFNSITITDDQSNTTVFWYSGATAAEYILIDPRFMRARRVTTRTFSLSSGSNASATLEYRNLGPLTFTSRRSGVNGTASGTFTIAQDGAGSSIEIRSRYAVV